MPAAPEVRRLLAELRGELPHVLTADRPRLSRQLDRLADRTKRGLDPGPDLDRLREALAHSRQTLEARRARLPAIEYPPELPVAARRDEIAAAIRDHPVVVINGATGSGKTTQLPKICLELGRGVAGVIGCTQPRRIAARNVAARVAQELKTPLGGLVGYKMRFQDQTGPDTLVKVMTDGILLAETQGDRWLSAYDTLIIDEAHERSLNIDFLLGVLRQLVTRRRDLKLVIASATLDSERFSRHFGGAPIVDVAGRTYPVEVRYRPPSEDEDEPDLADAVVAATLELASEAGGRPGDVLVFLPGEREIRETAEALRKCHPPHTEILPLYARLSAEEQQRVFAPPAGRRIVLATNVAETSLTVPGVRYVIDPGLARVKRYSHRQKVEQLRIEKISRAAADQRAGRCGRTAPGVCVRLYAEADYLERRAHTEPEVLRSSLAGVILQMHALKLGEPAAFPFLDAPSPRMIADGYQQLQELGAVDEGRRLTDTGRKLARLPTDPKIGRMLLEAQVTGALREVLVIASALSVRDPRERPLEHQAAADQHHARFRNERSDFQGLLKLWDFFQELLDHRKSGRKLAQQCRENFLSLSRLREWRDVHQQLHNLVTEMGLRANEAPADYAGVHQALLPGLLGQVGNKAEEGTFLGTRGIRFAVHPGSGLFKKPPRWLVAAEIVETSRLYARTVAAVEPDWVERAAAHLLKRHYFDPHWEKKRAQVMAYERVTLFGLIIVAKRSVPFAPLDPVAAREIFIREGLVAGELQSRAPFLAHNRRLVEEVEGLEQKARRQDILVDEAAVFAFYDARIPEGITGGQDFERWRLEAERAEPRRLFLRREALMRHEAERVTADAFPAFLAFHGGRFPLSYRFAPGEEDDGVTLTVPIQALNQIHPARGDWLVPGLLREKIAALLRSLPQSVRRNFVPVPEYARAAAEALTPGDTPLLPELAAFLEKTSGVAVPPDAWHPENLPPHLRLRYRVIDAGGEQIAAGRDLEALRARFGDRVRESFGPQEGVERARLTRWDFGPLPEQVDLRVRGVTALAFPALVDEGDSVAVRLFDTPAKANDAMRAGLCRLFWIGHPQQARYLDRNLPGLTAMCLHFLRVADCNTLKKDLLAAVCGRALFADSEPGTVRTRELFEARAGAAAEQLMTIANGLSAEVGAALAEFHRVAPLLDAAALAPYPDVLDDARQQLAQLIYPGFVSATPAAVLGELPRYLKALRLRLERLPRAPDRDRQQAALLAPLWRRYWQAPVKPECLETYRWMLEELRVSLFAQELRTLYPVSGKRLERVWEECLNARA